ncbi:hypothetical protein BDU57DRAFT_239221 [Ampelomyces quisqualis]|uniref:Uncharacterized protein n=1 Tax=Ampelomyces quisqualis TaxID=50730 RepID=A0A6A5QLK0_AMPQU|nr:hypothetical protein BDU57DRAFT_239221 [Ampelomyces quisqualis]
MHYLSCTLPHAIAIPTPSNPHIQPPPPPPNNPIINNSTPQSPTYRSIPQSTVPPPPKPLCTQQAKQNTISTRAFPTPTNPHPHPQPLYQTRTNERVLTPRRLTQLFEILRTRIIRPQRKSTRRGAMHKDGARRERLDAVRYSSGGGGGGEGIIGVIKR